MLEKSHNTSQRTSTFTSLREACYYQGIHGEKVYTISQCQTELNEVDKDEFETKETEGTKYLAASGTHASRCGPVASGGDEAWKCEG